MLAQFQRYLRWRRLQRDLRQCRQAEQQQAIEHSATKLRILNQGG
jgi:hypothetical protein